jgi:putative endonuclease
MKHSLYILQSKSCGKYYVGISQNPEIRVQYHNTIEKGFTSRYRPWEIVFIKEFENRELAMEAERKVKSWKSRKMIEKVITQEIKL